MTDPPCRSVSAFCFSYAVGGFDKALAEGDTSMTDEETRAEIANQIHETLVSLVVALRAETALPGGPVARITLGRAADAIQNVVNGQ